MVEWKKLGDVCEKTSNIKWKDQTDDKIYKYIDLSSVSLDSHKVIITTDICKQNAPSRAQQVVCANDILLGTTRPTLKRYCQIPSYLDKNICSTGFCIFRANKEYVLSRWLFHNIGSSKFWDYCELKQQGAGYPCLSNSDAFSYMIPTPSLSEQQRIVDILDTFTSSIDNLKQQIAQRRKQYEYYRDQLLDLERKEGVEMKPCGEVCEVTDYVANGSFATLRENVTYRQEPDYAILVRTIDLSNNFDGDKVYIDERAYKFLSKSSLFGGEIIINNIGAGVGQTFRCPCFKEKMSLGPNSILVRTPNNDFYYYWFNSIYGQNAIMKVVTPGAMPKFNKTGFKTITVPVPPLYEQQRIVDILDKFETSIHNLEAQLSQREKQYEYYRNKLLTFE